MSTTFAERLQLHAEHLEKVGSLCTTEETTKQALILPFLDILGFSAFDPNKVRAEYQADFVGVKAGERVDYALFFNNKPVMFIEAKGFSEKLDNHCPQLSRYFNATPEVAVCAITNGQEWRFFTDLENKNVMDSSPFLTIKINNLTDSDVAQLAQFRHDRFQPDALRGLAEESVYLSQFTKVITESLKDVDIDFVRYVVTKAKVQKQFTQKFLENIQPLVKKAVQNSVSSMLMVGLEKQEKFSEELTSNGKDDNENLVDPNNPKIITTHNERKLFDLIKGLLPASANVEPKDTETYYTILINGKNNRWICRYFDNKQRPSIIFPKELEDADIENIKKNGLTMGGGGHIIIDSPENVLRLAWLVRECYEFCCDDENYRRGVKQITDSSTTHDK